MKQLLLIAASVLFVTMVVTAQTKWTVDKSHSNVKFTVTHMLISEVEGSFNDFDANITTKGDDLTGAQIEATIKTASVFTNNEMRDNHLRSDDFFNAEKFPEMKFKSTSVEKTGEKTYKITGDLTIRDVTKSVVLDTKFTGQMVDQRGNTRSGFKATTTIKRLEYGVKWNKAVEAGGLVASDDVNITLLLEFMKPKQ
jgi:polyisoprenoid-binding protein YceI